MSQKRGAILILSGPSGCGKSTLLKEVYKDITDYYFSISTTTRSIREGEKHGVDYYFVSKDEFEKDIEDGNFLEHANVHGNYYGTSLKPILEALQENKLVIFDIDVQGHKIVRKKLNDIITSVFITTPSLKELEFRLNNRSTDSQEVIQKRILNAQEEIKSFLKYDYLIINDNLKVASKQLVSIANAARVKSKLSESSIIEEWLNA
ncbi:MAG: guanylate kinase [Arcobacteraceae bacterium]